VREVVLPCEGDEGGEGNEEVSEDDDKEGEDEG